MADFLTFANIQDEVSRGIKDLKQAKLDLVKAVINQVYYEMLNADDLFPLHWLIDFDDTLACVAPMTITGISAADPGVITVDAVHGLTDDADIVGIHGIVGTTELNNRLYLINSLPATTTLSLIDLNTLDAIDTTSLTAWSSGGTIRHMGKVLGVTGKNVNKILGCHWVGQRSMTPITHNELIKNPEWMGDHSALPSRYRHRKKYLEAGTLVNQLLWYYGASAAYDLRYWFEERPTRLIDDADVPLMPHEHHYGLVAGSVMRLAESKVEVESPGVWAAVYKYNVEQMVSMNRKYWKDQDEAHRRKVFMQ